MYSTTTIKTIAVFVMLMLGCSLLTTEAKGPKKKDEDYLSLPGEGGGTPLEGRRFYLNTLRQDSMIGYQNILQAGATAFTEDYARDVTLPSGLVGGQILAEEVARLRQEVFTTVLPINAAITSALAQSSEPETLADYIPIYQNFVDAFQQIHGTNIGVPDGAQGWETDEHFARLRLTYFPLWLERTTELPDGIPGNAGQLGLALQQGKLFHVNYDRLLENMTAVAGKYCNASWAQFRVRPGNWHTPAGLDPVAILVNGVWYQPTDGAAWTLAKAFCNCAEAFALQIEHFLATHLIFSPLATSMHRNIHPEHPFFAFMSPILDYIYGLAAVGFPGLFNPGTQYDLVAPFGSLGCHAYINREWSRYTWDQRTLHKDIERRGVQDLQGYAYKDDALRLWSIFRERAHSFLQVYYKRDSDLEQDLELQAWAAEVTARGNLVEFPPSIYERSALADLMADVMWACTGLHHVINAKAYYNYTLALPAIPASLYKAPPTDKAEVTEENLMEWFPSAFLALQQTSHTASFSFRYLHPGYTVLYSGLTANTGTQDSRSRDRFFKSLSKMSRDIQKRKEPSVLPFRILDPATLPLSGFV